MNQYAAGNAFYYDERTAAKAAAFLRTLESAIDTCLRSTGVRADWMEQDGPADVVPFFEELYGNTGYRYSNIQ